MGSPNRNRLWRIKHHCWVENVPLPTLFIDDEDFHHYPFVTQIASELRLMPIKLNAIRSIVMVKALGKGHHIGNIFQIMTKIAMYHSLPEVSRRALALNIFLKKMRGA